MTNFSLWVLLPPLLGFIILGVLGSLMPRGGILAIGWGACGLAFLFAIFDFFSVLNAPASSGHVSDLVIYNWMTAGSFKLDFGLLLDPLTATMLLVVTGVGFLIHIYSAGYMEDDPGFWRFFSYLNFFIFAMVLLVSADNFLFLLVGWGLVGLASFLLIGFWYQRPSAVAAAKKALVINIIGDFGLMIAIFLIFKQYGVLNYFTNGSGIGVFASLDPASVGSKLSLVIALCLFVACAAKSAQLPLYMWLPDAMEGPTPVSALIHAATMVTACVYLVARAHPLFEQSVTSLNIIAVIGAATALFAATIALFQLDIKRVLAYSTISQLGYMFMGEGAHDYSAGIFHLTTHAYFKALLFLAAGAVIHALAGEQDMRKMGGLWSRLPITAWTFLIAALAISGIFPFAGFWSKDDILSSVLAYAMTSGNPWVYILWGVGLLTVALTAFYMFRLFFGIFMGNYRGVAASATVHDEDDEEPASGGGHHGGVVSYYDIHEAPRIMTVPLLILGGLSIIGGIFGSFAIFGATKWHPLENFLSTVPGFSAVKVPVATIGVDWTSTGISLVLALIGIFFAWRLYGRGFQYKENTNPLYQLVLHKYYVDEILTAILIRPVLALSRGATRFLERDTLDGGARGVAFVFRGSSSGLRRLQTGYMRNYALAIMLGVVLIVLYYAVRG